MPGVLLLTDQANPRIDSRHDSARSPARDKNHRFPSEIISHGGWLYDFVIRMVDLVKICLLGIIEKQRHLLIEGIMVFLERQNLIGSFLWHLFCCLIT